MSKFSRGSMSLKQFLIRQEVLTLYRDIFRTLRQVSDKTNRLELRDWAREDFKKHMNQTEEYTIKGLLRHGRKSLDDLRKSLSLSDSSKQKKVIKE